ncbi:MAG: 4-hydroxybenzoate octaprenyltransferase [Gammaproteobacteria bacterium]|nr:4-hydroxybenzoate octaprenyltransferase [Gammaproteobacteria bacterium]
MNKILIKERLSLYVQLTRLHRPIGIYLLLWPTLWAVWFASEGRPNLLVLFVFVAGVILMRSAGCVINDYADRKIDPHVERTRERPIAAGLVSPQEALKLFAVLVLVSFLLVLLMNAMTIYLSFGALALASIYPFMKRHTYLPQVVLGAAFAWAIPMAYAAQTGSVPKEAWLLYVLTVLWTTVYDTMYGMVDREDDLKIGVKSTAILFGDADRMIIAVMQLAFIAGLFLLGNQLSMGAFYYMGVTIAIGLSVYQQYLIRERERAACFQAFLNNHWLGLAIFVGIVADYLLQTH